MTFTRGPWKISEVTNFSDNGDQYYRIDAIDSQGWFISGIAQARSKEDAQLIAAAPDLYEALKALTSKVENYKRDLLLEANQYPNEINLRTAQTALAKAEGK